MGGTTNLRDANGNLKDDGTFLYDHDYRNQLVKVTKKSDLSVVATYDYDGIGRRVAKTTSVGATQFYWVRLQMVAEYDGQGLLSRRHYGRTFGEVVSAHQRDVSDLDQDGSTTDYVPLTPLYDGAYDCISALDHTGAIAESYVHTYDGSVTITNAAGTPIVSSAIGWHQGYGRMYRDQGSGFLYSVHRYYRADTGRFLNEDPLGRWVDPTSLGNGYAWVGNGYRNGWDPLGLRNRPGVSPSARSVVDVMQAAATEAAAAMAGDGYAVPNDVTFFAEEINGDDVDIDAKGIAWTGHIGETHNKGGKYDYYRVILDYRRMLYWKSFTNTIVHEMLHVRYFRCGKKKGKHHTKEFYRRVRVTEGYLRAFSPTLQRFEAWLEHYEYKDLDSVEKAAKNALAGKSPPKKKK